MEAKMADEYSPDWATDEDFQNRLYAARRTNRPQFQAGDYQNWPGGWETAKNATMLAAPGVVGAVGRFAGPAIRGAMEAAPEIAVGARKGMADAADFLRTANDWKLPRWNPATKQLAPYASPYTNLQPVTQAATLATAGGLGLANSRAPTGGYNVPEGAYDAMGNPQGGYSVQASPNIPIGTSARAAQQSPTALGGTRFPSQEDAARRFGASGQEQRFRPAGSPTQSTMVPQPSQQQGKPVPLPPRRPADLGQPAGRVDYQSNGRSVMNPDGSINWGDPESPADFVRASKAMQQAQPGMKSGGAAERAVHLAKKDATPCHHGIINMAVGGRTDHIPMNVLEGSYVLPADIVSGLGEGNTLAGSKILDNMFSTGPFGQKPPQFHANPRFPSPGYQYRMTSPYEPPKFQADGGRTVSRKPVPIIAAGGEYVVHPDVVTKLGQGDMDAGHQYLDNFVKYVRKETAKTLQNLPEPRKD
jgi:hypothetical protein